MTSALRRFLPEFELPSGVRAAPAWQVLDRPAPPMALVVVDAEPGSPPEPKRDPVAEAVAAALAEVEVRHAAALAAAETQAAADLAEARATWAADEGQALADAFARATAAAGDPIADAVASLLEPFVEQAIRRACVEDLRQAVADLLAGGTGGRIAVSGPQDLLDALAAALAAGGVDLAGLDLTPSQAAEVAITADSSAVRTRLEGWMRALRRRLEGEA